MIGQICFKAFHCKQLVAFCYNDLDMMLMHYKQHMRSLYTYTNIYYISQRMICLYEIFATDSAHIVSFNKIYYQ